MFDVGSEGLGLNFVSEFPSQALLTMWPWTGFLTTLCFCLFTKWANTIFYWTEDILSIHMGGKAPGFAANVWDGLEGASRSYYLWKPCRAPVQIQGKSQSPSASWWSSPSPPPPHLLPHRLWLSPPTPPTVILGQILRHFKDGLYTPSSLYLEPSSPDVLVPDSLTSLRLLRGHSLNKAF